MGAYLALRWDHLGRLTDCTGLIQHAIYSLPDLASGYTTDDNARALTLLMRRPERDKEAGLTALAGRYLSFLAFAQTPSGWFRNFLDYSRRFRDEEGSEDCFARALQACAETMVAERHRPTGTFHLLARRLWQQALPHVPRLRALRAQALTLLTLHRYGQAFPDRHPGTLVNRLADNLVAAYRQQAGPGWRWFEEALTYGNALLPEALLVAYQATGKRSFLRCGLEALEFLTDCCFRRGYLKIVGNRHWYFRGESPAPFDEQPIDAGQFVEAYLEAYRVTGSPRYLSLARASLAWFHGCNELELPLVDETTGGCYDGLTPHGANLNQGAESLLAYLWATTLLNQAERGLELASDAGS